MPIKLDQFNEGKEPTAQDRTQQDYKGKVTEYLKANPKEAFTHKEIAIALEFEPRQIRGALIALEKANQIERRVVDIPATDGKGTQPLQHWKWVGE